MFEWNSVFLWLLPNYFLILKDIEALAVHDKLTGFASRWCNLVKSSAQFLSLVSRRSREYVVPLQPLGVEGTCLVCNMLKKSHLQRKVWN